MEWALTSGGEKCLFVATSEYSCVSWVVENKIGKHKEEGKKLHRKMDSRDVTLSVLEIVS